MTSQAPEHPESRGTVLLWGLGTLVSALAAGLVPLYFAHRFYFAGDTQTGAFGLWYHLGQELLAGHWPLFDPTRWGAGNFVAEGQWGLWNPVIMLIGILATSAQSAVVFSTVVKIAALVLGAGGGFLLVRSFGTRASSAALGGFAITLTGFTVYMDAASWVTGLFVWALWPYAWWGIRRTAYGGRNPFPALVAGYLLVTVGYVHGTLLLAITVAACIIEALVARRWRSALVTTALGLTVGLVALTVHLPSFLTVGVTGRKSVIRPLGSLSTNGGDLLTAALPAGVRDITVFDTHTTAMPLTYIAWFLPLLFFVRWSLVRRRPAEFVGLTVVLVASLAFVLAPGTMGPFRFPLRVMPYVASTVIVLAVVALDRGLVARPRANRLGFALAASLAPAYLAWAQRPIKWGAPVVAALLVALLVALVWWWLGRDRSGGLLSWRYDLFVVACVVACLGFTVVQHHYVPRSGLAEWSLPADVDFYPDLLSDTKGEVFVISSTRPVDEMRDRSMSDEELWNGFALANTWYLTDAPVANMYTPVNFKAYKRRFCVDFQGVMCGQAIERLFGHPEGLDVPRADLMSVSTVVINRYRVPQDVWASVPEGWHVASEQGRRLVWQRDGDLPPSGGVTYTDPGLEIGPVRRNDTEVSFRVDRVPSGGGQVVLSRLPWPGYSARNASLADPVADYLLTLSVPESSAGKTVTVTFTPPAWLACRLFWVLSVGITVVWSLAHAVLTWRRRRSTASEPLDERERVSIGG